ncbi:hypothetical protein [Thalassotalea crassostreae]|uniref:hypothetical protein n=1 Tax=Thalassotalea crassostreae TaxID=1763536 RepID=UPI000838CD7B|nr:hypothetical protein [Thalassotalea crassostreae]
MLRTLLYSTSFICLTACSSKPVDISKVDTETSPTQCQLIAQQGSEEGVYTSIVQTGDRQESLKLALANIANQRQVAIRSSATVSQQKSDGLSQQSYSRRISAVSEFVFDDYEVVCEDYVSGEVLIHFDDRSLPARIQSKLKKYYGQHGWQLSGKTHLLNSIGLQTILSSPGSNPQQLNVQVNRNSKGWVLAIGAHRFKLRDEEWRLLYSLPNNQHDNLQFYIENEFGNELQHALFHEQEFRFAVSGNLPKSFYLSIYYIDTRGKIVEIRANEFHRNTKKLLTPQQGIFTAELEADLETSIDDYLLVISQSPLARPNSPWLYQGWSEFFERNNALGLRLTIR